MCILASLQIVYLKTSNNDLSYQKSYSKTYQEMRCYGAKVSVYM